MWVKKTYPKWPLWVHGNKDQTLRNPISYILRRTSLCVHWVKRAGEGPLRIAKFRLGEIGGLVQSLFSLRALVARSSFIWPVSGATSNGILPDGGLSVV